MHGAQSGRVPAQRPEAEPGPPSRGEGQGGTGEPPAWLPASAAAPARTGPGLLSSADDLLRGLIPKFSHRISKRLLEGGRGLSEVATELGVSSGQLSTWRTEHLAAGSAEALALRKAEEAEMLRLKRENKRLEEENLILKKAAAFFARGIA